MRRRCIARAPLRVLLTHTRRSAQPAANGPVARGSEEAPSTPTLSISDWDAASRFAAHVNAHLSDSS